MAHSLQFSISTPSTHFQTISKRIAFAPKGDIHIPKLRVKLSVRSEVASPASSVSVSNTAAFHTTPFPVLPSFEGPNREAEAEPKVNGLRGTQRTKLVCTIGPATCGLDELEAMAAGGMSVARINMCHGEREWHRGVIERVRRINQEKGFSVAIMMDTQGNEYEVKSLLVEFISGDPFLKNFLNVKCKVILHLKFYRGAGVLLFYKIKYHDTSIFFQDADMWTFSVRSFNSTLPKHTVRVNYDGFAEGTVLSIRHWLNGVTDVKVGDEIVVDGGMARFEVIEKIGPDVKCHCTDPGLLLPGANLTFWRDGRLVQECNAMLPTLSSKDWLDIDFGIAEGVDFFAVSFVKSAEVINNLRSYIAARSCDSNIAVIAKIETVESLKNLEEIVQASDGVMVARGDLGAQIPLEQVPSVQEKIVMLCRQLHKPVIVASQLLESMIQYPIPTRAEVADVSEAVRQQADALMLSGESAMGQYPHKALSVLTSISLRMEQWWREGTHHQCMKFPDINSSPYSITEELCNAAAKMANKLGADALLVYTTTGHMASLLSRCRPTCPIFAFTPSMSVMRRMNLHWGLIPFCLNVSDDVASNLNSSISLLKARGLIKSGDTVVFISDTLQTIQVINVP
ncbi:hypothetical protein RJ639_031503 [Escallonia herrerae]|uniref:pyruvate kinase n=1 Tax=Escallonia herrerae TaxID=1293975 RepID=A0AA89BCL0_9ASTE|nr:hypothetical protein RJ639_031503 [Escallonia herrerae]